MMATFLFNMIRLNIQAMQLQLAMSSDASTLMAR